MEFFTCSLVPVLLFSLLCIFIIVRPFNYFFKYYLRIVQLEDSHSVCLKKKWKKINLNGFKMMKYTIRYCGYSLFVSKVLKMIVVLSKNLRAQGNCKWKYSEKLCLLVLILVISPAKKVLSIFLSILPLIVHITLYVF